MIHLDIVELNFSDKIWYHDNLQTHRFWDNLHTIKFSDGLHAHKQCRDSTRRSMTDRIDLSRANNSAVCTTRCDCTDMLVVHAPNL